MMREKTYKPDSLLHDTERDGKSFLSLFFSIICHLLIGGVIIFAPQYIPAYAPNPGFSPSSVINVSMVTLPAEEGATGENTEDNPAPEKNEPESEEPEAVNSPEPEKAEETAPVAEPEKTETEIPEPAKPEETVAPEPEKPKEAVVLEPEKVKEKKAKFEKPKLLEKEKIVEKPKEKPEPPKKTPPKPEVTKKDKTPEKKVVKAEKPKSEKPKSDQISGAPKDAIERIRQSLKKSSAGRGTGSGNGSEGTGIGRDQEGEGFGGTGSGGFGSLLGRRDSDALRFYRENVIPDAVNKNWAFSENMTRRRFNLEAVLVIRIMPNGEIADIWFERKSGDKYFDDSAYKAVIKSNPLPALPGGYGPYKVGLRFTPSGMK